MMGRPEGSVNARARSDESPKFMTPGFTFVLIVLVAGITLFSVYNVVKVNELLGEVRTMEYSRDSLVSVNNALVNDVVRLESSERITRVARERLDLVQPTNAPLVVEYVPVDPSRDAEE
ncbi:MAG: FtsB family cell division protein [Candidatus Kapaibacterium sp.]